MKDLTGSHIIDFDAVFRDKIDPTTFGLHIGCGRCLATSDAPPRVPVVYQTGEFEPFTQTRYYSAFPKTNRVYNVSNILQNCSAAYFTIYIIEYKNQTSELVWGPVIGLEENLHFWKFLSFPFTYYATTVPYGMEWGSHTGFSL